MTDHWIETRHGMMLQQEPDEEAPPDRCPGPSYDNAHGCGRFLSTGSWMCPRCDAETKAYWEADLLHEKQLQAQFEEYNRKENEYWDAYYASPEGQAELNAHRQWIEEMDEDLPF